MSVVGCMCGGRSFIIHHPPALQESFTLVFFGVEVMHNDSPTGGDRGVEGDSRRMKPANETRTRSINRRKHTQSGRKFKLLVLLLFLRPDGWGFRTPSRKQVSGAVSIFSIRETAECLFWRCSLNISDPPLRSGSSQRTDRGAEYKRESDGDMEVWGGAQKLESIKVGALFSTFHVYSKLFYLSFIKSSFYFL